MYGNYINELLLNNRGKNVWKLAGDQGDQLKKAQVTLTGNYQVEFFVRCFPSFYIIIKRLSTHHTNDN